MPTASTTAVAPALQSPVLPPNSFSALSLLRPPNMPIKIMPDAQKSFFRLAPVHSCVKSVGGLCFCVNCLITNSKIDEKNDSKKKN